MHINTFGFIRPQDFGDFSPEILTRLGNGQPLPDSGSHQDCLGIFGIPENSRRKANSFGLYIQHGSEDQKSFEFISIQAEGNSYKISNRSTPDLYYLQLEEYKNLIQDYYGTEKKLSEITQREFLTALLPSLDLLTAEINPETEKIKVILENIQLLTNKLPDYTKKQRGSGSAVLDGSIYIVDGYTAQNIPVRIRWGLPISSPFVKLWSEQLERCRTTMELIYSLLEV